MANGCEIMKCEYWGHGRCGHAGNCIHNPQADEITELDDFCNDLQAENKRLIGALGKYARHRGSCNTNFIDPNGTGGFYSDCTCGLKAALNKKGSE